MKSLVVFFALCAATFSLPSPVPDKEVEEPIPILTQESDSGFDGSFTNNYETGNGIAVEQTGSVKTIQDDKGEKNVQEIVGSYSYTAPDGTLVQVDYVANERGFQPQGDILPVAPPPPPIIARALKFIKDNPPKEEEPKV